jgi:hypothetical protein
MPKTMHVRSVMHAWCPAEINCIIDYLETSLGYFCKKASNSICTASSNAITIAILPTETGIYQEQPLNFGEIKINNKINNSNQNQISIVATITPLLLQIPLH